MIYMADFVSLSSKMEWRINFDKNRIYVGDLYWYILGAENIPEKHHDIITTLWKDTTYYRNIAMQNPYEFHSHEGETGGYHA